MARTIDLEVVHSITLVIGWKCSEFTDMYSLLYPIDGSEPDDNSLLYKEPFIVKRTTKIKIRAYKDNQMSLPAHCEIEKEG
jgi:hypothetical protein